MSIPLWLQIATSAQRQRTIVRRDELCEVSATQLIAPAHQTRLIEQHAHELPDMDPIEQLPSLIGTAWHQFVAELDHPPHVMVEHQLDAYLTVDDQNWLLTGTPDWFDPHAGLLVDHKTARVWSYVYGKREWEEQLNIYAWLLAQHGHRVDRAEVHAIYLDWSEKAASRNSGYPPRRMLVLDVNLWSPDDQRNFVFARLRRLMNPELCTAEERWQRNAGWAVMKHGRKSALRVFDTASEAEEMVLEGPDDLYLERREGDPVRCRSWCPVKDYCEFGRKI